MKKLMLVLAVVGALLILGIPAFAGEIGAKIKVADNIKPLTGTEGIQNVPYHPSMPGLIAVSPGDTVGYTQYDYQTNGSTGNRVALDSQNGVHFAWMNGISYPGTRRIFYNYRSADGSYGWPGQGTNASVRAVNVGYTTMDVTNDDRAAIIYHLGGTSDSLFLAIDSFTGFGIFDFYRPSNRFGAVHLLWPYMTISQNGDIHVTASQYTASAGQPQIVGYTRSENGGTTWVAPQRVDTVMTISTIVTSSPVSNKVAIVYTHPRDTTSQWRNNVYYIQSQNGTTWDWANGKTNITHYGSPDSLWAYTDCDAVYDYNDNLHIVWNGQYISPADGSVYFNAQLFHYSTGTGTITQVYQFDSTFLVSGCDFGNWNFSIAKMSIGVDAGNNLFTTYTSWDTSDCSAGGFANGDIYMNYSLDGGATWSQKINMTDSHTPGCAPGDCDSDHWSSLAEKVDSYLHLFYVNDKDAGGIPQSEGVATDNPMLYYRYANPTGVVDNEIVPKDFTLAQNYPNPFNAQTNISFKLDNAASVNLAVYDVTGAKVATLVNGQMNAGDHQVVWDANKIASGVYYYTLKANGGQLTKKMVLLK